MNYKKRYTEALERARKFSEKPLQEDSADIVEYIFPELKESEDEKMKTAIKYVLYENYTDAAVIKGVEIAEIVAWLEEQGKRIDDAYLQGICDAKHEIEKQGEKLDAELGQSEVTKTSDQELEPKFKVGDCVISNDGTHTYIVKERKRGTYVILDINGGEFSIDIETADRTGRFWAIQDAKDGDVLATEDKNFTIPIPFIAIYKNLGRDNLTFNSHCFIGFDENFYEGEDGHTIEGIHPATKEQRDLLFAKMRESGYEWDSEKKKLKKI